MDQSRLAIGDHIQLSVQDWLDVLGAPLSLQVLQFWGFIQLEALPVLLLLGIHNWMHLQDLIQALHRQEHVS